MVLMVSIFIFCSDVEDVVCILGEGGLILRREAGLPGFQAIAVSLGNKIKPRTYNAFYGMYQELILVLLSVLLDFPASAVPTG